MLQSEITGDGMDAVASEISLVEWSSRCAIHIFTQTRFLDVTVCNYPPLALHLIGMGVRRTSRVSAERPEYAPAVQL